jgi:UDP-glucose 4-epimerase
MNYLVTGGAGFLGSYIVKRLINENENHTVIVYNRKPIATSIQEVLTPDELSRVILIPGDMTNLDQLLRTCEVYKVERLIHMASMLTSDSNEKPYLAPNIMCVGTVNVFETARQLKIPRVVWASSTAVFGQFAAQYPEYEWLPNDAPHYPYSYYGACKHLCEFFAEHYFSDFGVDSIGLRFPVVYGPGRLRGAGNFVNEVVNKPAVGEKGNVTYCDDPINFLYADDAARCSVMAARAPHTETRVFTMSGSLCTLNQVADITRSLIPDADITVNPGVKGRTFKYSAEQLEKELGFKPEWSMEAGVKETIRYLRAKADLKPVF